MARRGKVRAALLRLDGETCRDAWSTPAGPGEHRWINFFGSVGGDTVIAVDFPNSRINWVSAGAGFLRSARLDQNGFKKVFGDDADGIVELMVPPRPEASA
jgi:hypothetical protein